MKTVVAETVFLGKEAFETLGEVEVIPDRQIEAKHLQDADALIIRSKTKVTADLLAGSSVRFVGTATAGFEHIDFQALEKNGIGWTASPGCNAASVADYIMAAILSHSFKGVGVSPKTLGIIGVGQVGGRVAARAEALGLRVLLNDPPRAARESSSFAKASADEPNPGKSDPDISKHWKKPAGRNSVASNPWKKEDEKFQTLEKLLAESDIVTMHVPLVTEKPWPTLRMADCRFFEKMKRGAVFINASRGQVLDADALLHAKANGVISHAVLDVWDPEPCIRTEVLDIADIGTAHIAGHSLEGKLNGTVQTYREACHFFETQPVWDPAPLLPELTLPELQIDSRGKTDHEVLAEAALAAYDIVADDAALREAAVPDETERAENFDFLRANYGVRREFFNTKLSLSEDRPDLMQKLCTLGFSA